MQFQDGDGRVFDIPDDSEIAEYVGGLSPAHLVGFDVTLARGDLWFFPSPMATEASNLRVLSRAEIKKRASKAGVLASRALPSADPVTGLTRDVQEDAIAAGRPIPQLAAEMDADGTAMPGTVAVEA